MSATIDLNKLVSRKKLAEITGLSARMIESLKANREIVFYKIGRLTMYKPSDIFRWIEERKHVAS